MQVQNRKEHVCKWYQLGSTKMFIIEFIMLVMVKIKLLLNPKCIVHSYALGNIRIDLFPSESKCDKETSLM